MTPIAQRARNLLVLMASTAVAFVAVGTVPAAAAEDVDLVVALTGPASGNAGDSFSYDITISNLGPGSANGSTAVLELDPAISDAALACDQASGGAACPDDLSVTSTGKTIDIAALPNGGRIDLKLTGTLPKYPSMLVSLKAEPGANHTEIDTSNNLARQTTVVALPHAEVNVTKTASTPTPSFGDQVTYTVIFENTGSSDLVDFEVHDSVKLMDLDQGNWDAATFSTSCPAASTAGCFEPKVPDEPVDGSKVVFVGTADIGVGEQLVVEVTADFAIAGCAVDGSVRVENSAGISAAEGYTMSGTNHDEEYVTISDVPVCEVADIVITKDQSPLETNNGEPRQYTVTYTNNGSVAVTGINVDERVYYANVPIGQIASDFSVTCDAASTAPCPTWVGGGCSTGDDVAGATIALFEGQQIDLPANSTLLLNIELISTITGCTDAGYSTITNNATIYGPVTTGPYLPSAPQLAKQAGRIVQPACERVTLSADLTLEPTTSALLDSAVYTMTLTNPGDNDIVGYPIKSNTHVQDGSRPIWRIRCDEASSACPSWIDPAGTLLGGHEPNSFSPVSYVTVDGEEVVLEVDIPAKASLILEIERIGFAGRTSCSNSGELGTSFSLYQYNNQSIATSGGQIVTSPFSVDARGTVWCGDLVTNTKIGEADPEPDSPITVTSTISSARGIARDAEVKIQLPEGGFDFDATSEIRCTATGEVTCPTFSYDAATHSVTGTVAEFGATGASLEVQVDGFTGVVPPRAAAYTVSTTVESRGEVDATSNTSTNNFTYQNQRASIPVTLAITGEADWVGEPVTFAGELACSGSESRDFELVVDRKTLGATFELADVWFHDECSVTLTEPDAPTGTQWTGWGSDNPITIDDIAGDSEFAFQIGLARIAGAPTMADASAVIDPGETATLEPETTPGDTPLVGIEFSNGSATVELPGQGVWRAELVDGQPVITFTPIEGFDGPATPQLVKVTNEAGLGAVAQLSVEVRTIQPTTNPSDDATTEPSGTPTLHPTGGPIAETGSTYTGWLVGLALLLVGVGVALLLRRSRT